jgi:hypothetical protein
MAKVTGILGDGSSTVFNIVAGFNTADAIANLRDAVTFVAIVGFGVKRETPVAGSVQLELTPPPLLDGVEYSISDGSEEP